MRNSHNIFAGIKISIGALVVTELVAAAASKRGAVAVFHKGWREAMRGIQITGEGTGLHLVIAPRLRIIISSHNPALPASDCLLPRHIRSLIKIISLSILALLKEQIFFSV